MSDEITPVKGYAGDDEATTGPVARSSSAPLYVTDLKPDDVLLGRGNPVRKLMYSIPWSVVSTYRFNHSVFGLLMFCTIM